MASKQEHIRVLCRLRAANPQDDEHDCRGGPSSAAFLTPQDECDESCFDSFDEGSGECVYQPPARQQASDGRRFRFDRLLGPTSGQDRVFAQVTDIVAATLDGYNGAVLAYGQTGSGKTHTMRGSGGRSNSWDTGPGGAAGVVPRALAQLLSARGDPRSFGEVSISLSCVQVYCEMLQDLLCDAQGATGSHGQSLTIKDSQGSAQAGAGPGGGGGGGVTVAGLSRVPITSLSQAELLLCEADARRSVSSTQLNAHSSRSHACYLVQVERRLHQPGSAGKPVVLVATLTLVDLAGSERVKRSGAAHQRLEESKAINLSLAALGNCVAALAQQRQHVPYRDSKLTRLLSASLGGEARTALIVTLAPGGDTTGENLGSLKFAARASQCKVAAVRNEVVDYRSLYERLLASVDTREDSLHGLEVELAAERARGANLETRARKAEDEKASALDQLERATKEYKASVSAMGGDGAAGTDAVEAIEAVNERWRAELHEMEAKHEADNAQLQERWERQLEAYKEAAARANGGWAAAEEELGVERGGYLDSLQKSRELRAELEAAEKEASRRVAELFADLEAKDRREAELVAALESAQRTADLSLSKAGEMATRLEGLEMKQRGQAQAIDHDFVSREQVAEMEALFKETVDRLTERIESLADNQTLIQATGGGGGGGRGGSGGGGPAARSRMDPQARRALADLEAASARNPLLNFGRGVKPPLPPGGRAMGVSSGWPAEPKKLGGGIRRGVEGAGGAGRGVRIEPGKLRARASRF